MCVCNDRCPIWTFWMPMWSLSRCSTSWQTSISSTCRLDRLPSHSSTSLHAGQVSISITVRGEFCPVWAPGCKNRAHCVSLPEVVKCVPNRGVDCFVSWGSFFCFSFVFLVYVVLCLIVFGCQYQCNWLPGRTRLWNDLFCVEWNVKPYTLPHSFSYSFLHGPYNRAVLLYYVWQGHSGWLTVGCHSRVTNFIASWHVFW